jgi:hypothetical protein
MGKLFIDYPPVAAGAPAPRTNRATEIRKRTTRTSTGRTADLAEFIRFDNMAHSLEMFSIDSIIARMSFKTGIKKVSNQTNSYIQ